MAVIKLIVLSFRYVTSSTMYIYLVVLLTTFNIYKFYTHNGDDIP